MRRLGSLHKFVELIGIVQITSNLPWILSNEQSSGRVLGLAVVQTEQS